MSTISPPKPKRAARSQAAKLLPSYTPRRGFSQSPIGAQPDVPDLAPQPTDAAAGVTTSPAAPFPAEVAWTDLADNPPGRVARARAEHELDLMRKYHGALKTFVARATNAKTDERSWRVRADGEEMAGALFEELRPAGWRVLHSVPAEGVERNIDHLLIGPGGVFAINTETHPNGDICVDEDTVLVNGYKQTYLRESRFAAASAAKSLSAAVGRPVEVTPALIFLSVQRTPRVKVTAQPEGVVILRLDSLLQQLNHGSARLDPAEVDQVYDYARRSSTWR